MNAHPDVPLKLTGKRDQLCFRPPLACILVLPIPFLYMLPKAAMACRAAGRADRDGVMVAARHVLALATPCLAVAVARGAHAGLLSLMGPVGT